jgi:hypothetical protein
LTNEPGPIGRPSARPTGVNSRAFKEVGRDDLSRLVGLHAIGRPDDRGSGQANCSGQVGRLAPPSATGSPATTGTVHGPPIAPPLSLLSPIGGGQPHQVSRQRDLVIVVNSSTRTMTSSGGSHAVAASGAATVVALVKPELVDKGATAAFRTPGCSSAHRPRPGLGTGRGRSSCSAPVSAGRRWQTSCSATTQKTFPRSGKATTRPPRHHQRARHPPVRCCDRRPAPRRPVDDRPTTGLPRSKFRIPRLPPLTEPGCTVTAAVWPDLPRLVRSAADEGVLDKSRTPGRAVDEGQWRVGQRGRRRKEGLAGSRHSGERYGLSPQTMTRQGRSSQPGSIIRRESVPIVLMSR